MGEVKRRYKDTKLNTFNKMLLDSNTGEISDIGNITVMERKDSGEIMINSKAYVVLDTQCLTNILNKGIKEVDLALLISLSSNLLIGHNICMKNEFDPHTTATIAIQCGYTVQAVKKKLNRLLEQNVLYYGIFKDKKSMGKVYVVNPHLIRKGNKLRAILGDIFNDIK